MLRRGAGQVTRGYVSFIERNSVGLVNIDNIAQNSGSVDELIKIQRQLEYWIDEPNRIRVICFEGCDAIFKQLRETKDTGRDETMVSTMSLLMRTITESLTPTVALSEKTSTLSTGLDKLTDYAVPVYSKADRSRFLDELDSVAKEGSTNEVRTFCQTKSPRKPPTKFAREIHCKQMLIEYEASFMHLLDQADDDELLMQFISK